jgi:predicted histone-like DNA-binding protein
MSVKYKAIERVNPMDLTLKRKFYAALKSGDKVTFEELADLISKVSGLNYGEVLGALGSFLEIIEIQLRHGRSVHLNTLGTFFLTLNSEGTDTAEELTSDNIVGAKIRFRPGKRLKKLIKTLDFVKVSPENGNDEGPAV